MNIDTKLELEIDSELEALDSMEVGSETYKATVDGLGKLLDRAIELERLEQEYEDKTITRKAEEEFKNRQLKEEKIDRWIKNGLAVTGIVVPTLLTVWGTVVSLNFEKEGTVTTGIGRGFINKLLPKNWK